MMKLCFHVPATHLETVEECRVEMVCDDHCIVAVVEVPLWQPCVRHIRMKSLLSMSCGWRVSNGG